MFWHLFATIGYDCMCNDHEGRSCHEMMRRWIRYDWITGIGVGIDFNELICYECVVQGSTNVYGELSVIVLRM